LKRPRRNWSGKGLSSERSRRERKKGNESGGASVAVEVASCAADIEDVDGGRIRLSVSGMGVLLTALYGSWLVSHTFRSFCRSLRYPI
jgi:hypothetical protein